MNNARMHICSAFLESFIGMDPIKPNAGRVCTIRIHIGERGGISLSVPLLTARGAGMAADADVKVDHEAEFLLAGTLAGGK
jgi:hypothetical protein